MAGKCDKEPAPKIGFVGLKGQSRAARHKNMAVIEDIERIMKPEHRQPITPSASSIAVLQRGLCQKGR